MEARGWASLLLLAGALAGCIGASDTQPLSLDLPAARPALFEGFHDPEAVAAFREALVARAPLLVEPFTLGESVEGRGLPGARVTAPGDGPKARVLVDAGIHGNEVYGVESVLYLAAWLVENHGRNATATRILEQADIRFVFLLNPDGRVAMTRPNARGVNMNRNFDVDFGNPNPLCRSQSVSPRLYEVGGSTFDYSGPRPLSEPETAALAAYMEEFQPQIYLSYHTGRHALIRPWAACDPPYPMPPEDDAVFEAIESWVQNHTTYKNTGTADETARRERLFPPGAASGSSTDWCYLTHHCIALTPEVTLLFGEAEEDPTAIAEEALPVALHMLEHAPDYAAWRVP